MCNSGLINLAIYADASIIIIAPIIVSIDRPPYFIINEKIWSALLHGIYWKRLQYSATPTTSSRQTAQLKCALITEGGFSCQARLYTPEMHLSGISLGEEVHIYIWHISISSGRNTKGSATSPLGQPSSAQWPKHCLTRRDAGARWKV